MLREKSDMLCRLPVALFPSKAAPHILSRDGHHDGYAPVSGISLNELNHAATKGKHQHEQQGIQAVV